VSVAYLFRSYNENAKYGQKALQLAKAGSDVGCAGSHNNTKRKETSILTIDISTNAIEACTLERIKTPVQDSNDMKKYDTILLLMNGCLLVW
jgi:hypothetical protein